jgi:hypothetical protein
VSAEALVITGGPRVGETTLVNDRAPGQKLWLDVDADTGQR